MFQKMNLGQKLTSVLVLVLLMTFLVGAVVLETFSSRLIKQSAVSSAETMNKLLVDMVDVFVSQVERGADRLMSALQMSLREPIHLDTEHHVQVADKNTPSLRMGSHVLNGDYSLVDRFTQETGGVATFFVRQGDEFIRIATSVKKEDGSRAVGTTLDHAHPAYVRILNGETYRGPAKLFGRDYFTKYVPILDKGTVIGITFIGADFTDELKALREKIKATKIGDSGYPYVLNAKDGPQLGQLIVHPEKEGQSILEATDAEGRFFIKEILQSKQGVTAYPWKNADESSAREKVVAYGYNKSLNWVIASGAYIDDLGKTIKTVMLWVGGIGFILAVFLPVLIYFTVHQLVTRPLEALQSFCQEIQTSHNFTLPPPRTGNDEVGKTCTAVANLTNALRSTFGRLMNNVQEVDAAAHKLAQSSTMASRQSDVASDSASAMAASVEQMTVGINHIADSASTASTLAREAGERSAAGGKTILTATHEMAQIADEVRQASSVIHNLSVETGKISSIISVIKDVADQTNLLALNAAIEAARAGESGRGFAVVADEVRKLAERTAHSTGEISATVTAIQALSDQATNIMQDAVSQVEHGAQLAGEAGTAIGAIQESSRKVVEVVEEISLALGEQSSASQQIAQQTENVARIAEENSHAATSTARSADQLEQLGEQIRSQVQQFKI